MKPDCYTRVTRTSAGTRLYRQHCHADWEVLYYTKNSGYLRLGENMEEAVPFREGTLICVPPLLVHGSAGEGVFENICVQERHFPKDLIPAEGARTGPGGCVVFQNTGADLLYLFQMIFRTFVRSPGSAEARIDHLMTCVYDVLMEQCRMPAASSFPVERMKDAILEHFTDPSYRVTDSMGELLRSPASVRTAFREECGMTPVQYLRMIRLKHAASLLENAPSSVPVSEIAYSSGFSDPLYFSKCFRQTYGLSPQSFRERTASAGEGARKEKEKTV